MKNKTLYTAGISAVAHYLPDEIRTSRETEKMINLHVKPEILEGTIERLTGIKQRYISHEEEYNSTLAIEACKLLFQEEKINLGNIDLLIFASAGQDILEPATAHIVQQAIANGNEQCPVMDVTNACNSFLNALEIATAFIQIGKYKSILIATGEVPSKAAKYDIESRHSLNQYIAGYTFGDAGTAVLVDRKARIATVCDSYFFADSSNWDAALFPGGGSRFLNKPDAYYFRGDAELLMKPFFVHTKNLLNTFLAKNSITMADIQHVFVHQVAEQFLGKMCEELGIQDGKIQMTIQDYGNVAAASLPLSLYLRMQNNWPKPGSLGLFVGLAGGISIGFTLVKFK